MCAPSAVIVGGSLGGLSAALALSRTGVASTVLERTVNRTQRGVAIRAAGAPLERAIGPVAYRHVATVLGEAAISQGALPHAWWDVYTALRAAANADPAIRIVEGVKVAEAGQDGDTSWARADSGESWRGDVLIGADGYGSVVRHYVAGEQRYAAYAGYIAWLVSPKFPKPTSGASAEWASFRVMRNCWRSIPSSTAECGSPASAGPGSTRDTTH